MRWSVYYGDLLDVPAEGLVCSANVFLNLSGGVGGAFLLRHGPAMQDLLHRYLADRSIRHVGRGEVIAMPSCGSPYRVVLHAIAVDGFYDSSPEIVTAVTRAALRRAAGLSIRTVALAALATGYGRMSMSDYARGLSPILREEFPPIEQVTIGLRSASDVEELVNCLPLLGQIDPVA